MDEKRGERRTLTERQREVLGGVRRGLANKEIAYELGVGTDDVKRIVSGLLALFHAPNRTALAQAVLPGTPGSCGFDLDFLGLFEEAPLAILATLGPDHVPCFANRAALATIPARPELPLVGTSLRAALSGIECQEFFQLVEGSFRTGQVSVATQVPLTQSHGDRTRWSISTSVSSRCASASRMCAACSCSPRMRQWLTRTRLAVFCGRLSW